MHVVGQILFGLVVGIVAKLVFPGHNPGGIIVTALLGMAGAWLGGYLGRALGWYEPGHPAGFLMAVVGALVLLFVYHMFTRERTREASIPSPITVVTVAATPVNRFICTS